jgi:hypothetical protein
MPPALSHAARLALLVISFSSATLAQDDVSAPAQHPIHFGMTAGVFKRTGDAPNTSTDLILLPDQELHVSVALTRRVRAEIPFTLFWTKNDGDRPVSTTVVGVLGDFFPGRQVAGEQSGVFVGGGATLHRLPTDGDPAYQWGLTGRAGYEYPIGGLLIRAAAMYERRFAADRQRSRSVYGVAGGVGFPIYGERLTFAPGRYGNAPGSVSPWYLNFGAALNYMTYGDDNALTTIDIPSPYVGIFSMLGLQRRLAVGGRATYQYASVGSTTNEHIRIAPRVEYHLSRENLRRKDLKLGAQMIFDGVSFASITGSSSGTQIGFGGDVSFTVPRAPTIWNFGIGVDHFRKEAETVRPATTSLRFEIGLDRYLVHR